MQYNLKNVFIGNQINPSFLKNLKSVTETHVFKEVMNKLSKSNGVKNIYPL